MSTDADGARTAQIEGRVVEWVNAALTTASTSDGIDVTAAATRAASLPDDGLEVRPEDWTVRIALRFSEADRAASGDVLGTIAEAGGTVTLDGGEAAEIQWPEGSTGAATERVDGAPEDKPLRCEVPVQVTIPWPSRNDAAAGPA